MNLKKTVNVFMHFADNGTNIMLSAEIVIFVL